MSEQAVALLPEIAVAAAMAWGAGLRLYVVLFALGAAGRLGWIELPEEMALLESPIVMAASGFMSFVEFFADKLPWVDSLWDAVHTFIRIPAGAALAAAVFGDSTAAVMLAAAILGGTLTAGAHLAKAGTRGAVNASPEPFSNWALSFGEDVAVPTGLALAYTHPVVFLVVLALFLVGAVVLLRFIARGLAALLRRVGY